MGNQYSHKWSEEDFELLENCVGKMSIDAIAKKLGRTPIAVARQIDNLGIGDMQVASNSITMHSLAKCLHVHDKKIKKLVIEHGLPAKRRDFRIRRTKSGNLNERNEKKLTYYINIEDFWQWAEAHAELIDWYQLEKNTLVPEPEWVDSYRIKKLVSKQDKPFSWTEAKNQKLLNLFYKENFSQKEIAKIMGCSYNALRKQLYRLRKNHKTTEAI